MWYPKYQKAITLSYDDGIDQDKRLVELLNRYGLKATFNINTGLCDPSHDFIINGHTISHLSWNDMKTIYRGHEVAVHTLTHPHLTHLSDQEVLDEINRDINNIQNIFHIEPVGMVYPYGSYDDRIVNLIKETKLRYARTVESNHSTHLQEDLLRFRPTCHQHDPLIHHIVEDFLNNTSNHPQILYIWGHSYEGDVDHMWEDIEALFKKIAFQPGIYYGTNEDVLLPFSSIQIK